MVARPTSNASRATESRNARLVYFLRRRDMIGFIVASLVSGFALILALAMVRAARKKVEKEENKSC